MQICSLEIRSVRTKQQVKKAVAFPLPLRKSTLTADSCEAQTHLFFTWEISYIHPEYEYMACIITSTQKSRSD